MAAGRAATSVLRSLVSPAAALAASTKAVRLVDAVPKAVVDDIFACALRKQTGVSLKYMLDFGARPIERQVGGGNGGEGSARRERGREGERTTTTRSDRPLPPHPHTPQLLLSAQFLHNELPVRLAHRVAELENLPYGLSAKAHVLKV